MGAAFRIILIIVLAWYLIRFIDRYIVPALFGSPEKDKAPPGTKERKFRKSTRQGDVTITDYGKRSEDENAGDDDYVDYEEVK
ncbi:MAG: hypothetical protein KAT15_10565 [Bacteroidales bacterium]|nr:hypothetical protein [Bacteroidales bacterium]